MGGLIGNNSQKKKEFIKANKLLGREIRCETCGKNFEAETPINSYNNHIKTCFQVNRERDRIENLINDLRETNLEIEYLEKNKNKKKDSSKINKKEKTHKYSTENNSKKINKNLILDPSDIFFISPEVLFGGKNFTNQIDNKMDDFDEYDISSANLETIKSYPFEDKLKFFRNYVKDIKVDWRDGSCNLEIDREDFFRQSMLQFEKIDPYKELKINFRGEVSHDAGGLIREWYSIIFKYILSPEARLFEKSDSDDFSYRFSKNINPSVETLDIMYFIGKIIAKALLDNLTINACFNKLIYKMIVFENVALDDLVFIDRPLYNSMKELKKMDHLDDLGIFFNLQYEMNGKLVSEDLIPNGSTIHVNKENIDDYIIKRIEHLQLKDKNFVNEIKNGIFYILPEKLICIFNSDELELFINGQPFIDLDDWRLNTVYKGFNSGDSVSNLIQKI